MTMGKKEKHNVLISSAAEVRELLKVFSSQSCVDFLSRQQAVYHSPAAHKAHFSICGQNKELFISHKGYLYLGKWHNSIWVAFVRTCA